MKSIYRILSLSCIVICFASCADLIEPLNDNHNTFERVYKDPAYAEGLLINAYTKLPTATYSFNDIATDDAVSNVKSNTYLKMATGEWTALQNPMSIWNNANEAILYLNLFIPAISEIKWANEENNQKMFEKRMLGEAYALRGIFRYYLLQSIAGKSSTGEMLGIPLFDNFLNSTDNFNLVRADFTSSIQAINSDLDIAISNLPLDFLDITAQNLPQEYANVALADYNKIFGSVNNQRANKRIALAFKAKAALLAASPAFNESNSATLWEKAANENATLLNLIGGVTGLDPTGHLFYQGDKVDAVAVENDKKEIVWRTRANGLSSSLEKKVFPPSLNGNGDINPTQNLVDAFPTKSGYPINNATSGYNAQDPYKNRDPRLTAFILFNGSTIQSKTIRTSKGNSVDAKDSLTISSRTGYYLRKLIREDVIFSSSGSATTKKHYNTHVRYTELFLNYAEAANEAWGPTGLGSFAAYTSKDVIAAIRKRAGISQPDNYLSSISTKEDMRTLIRNERRIELCFEGFRFWDLRRWGLSLNETATGINISKDNLVYSTVEVEKRLYKPYMQFGPLPYNEVINFSSLKQNEGW